MLANLRGTREAVLQLYTLRAAHSQHICGKHEASQRNPALELELDGALEIRDAVKCSCRVLGGVKQSLRSQGDSLDTDLPESRGSRRKRASSSWEFSIWYEL